MNQLIKSKLILVNLFALRFHLFFKLKFTCPTTYYYLLGSREKYIFFNLSVLVEILIKLQKFLKYSLKTNNSFCFVSFNPVYFLLTKQIALKAGQSYIIGSWVNGFFSRSIPSYLNVQQKDNHLKFNFKRSNTPIFIFVSFDNAENFFSEISYLYSPVLGIVNASNNISKFAYPIVCETFSLETVFFYTRLISFFLTTNEKTT